ncbi:unnamed protein product, partial [Prorocentrum cordatum]
MLREERRQRAEARGLRERWALERRQARRVRSGLRLAAAAERAERSIARLLTSWARAPSQESPTSAAAEATGSNARGVGCSRERGECARRARGRAADSGPSVEAAAAARRAEVPGSSGARAAAARGPLATRRDRAAGSSSPLS